MSRVWKKKKKKRDGQKKVLEGRGRRKVLKKKREAQNSRKWKMERRGKEKGGMDGEKRGKKI